MEKIRCSFIGLGRIASLLEDDPLREKPCTHAGAVSLNPHCAITGGCDTASERRELFKARWSCPVYAAPAELLRETAPDILFIATHPDTHLEITEIAVKYGIKVIVCEKPAADTLKKAEKIASFHKKGKAKIIINHERRYSADYNEVKKHICEKTFGRLLSINAFLYMGRNKKIKNVLWHDGTHMADVIMYLTGSELRRQKTTGSILKKEGTVIITADAGGVFVTLQAGAERDHLTFAFSLSFERGMIRIGNGIFEIWESGKSPYYEGFNSLINTGVANFTRTGYFENMVSDAVQAFREPEYEPVSTAVDGYRAVKFLSSL